LTDRSQPNDDALLAQRIRSGDREALGELYDRYASVALATALRIVNDRAQAEDLVHDTFVAAWQKIDRFDPVRGSLRAWLLTIVRNRGIDRIRAARPTLRVDEADEQSLLRTAANPTWEAAIARRSAAELRSALDQLPAEQREAIELAYFGGRTQVRIAEEIGIPVGTVKTRTLAAMRKLRKLLEEPAE